MNAELTDRVPFCVVKANCGGPSLLAGTASGPDRNDKWVCRKCGGYVTIKTGEIPQKDQRRAGQ